MSKAATTVAMDRDAGDEANASQGSDVAAVLSELQSLRTTVSAINTKISTLDGLDIKLDKMEKHLTDMNGAVEAMQVSFAGFKQDIIANAERLTEAEVRLGVAEDDLHSVKKEQTNHAKCIAFLESKADDLENCARGNNLGLVGLPENVKKTQPISNRCCRCGWGSVPRKHSSWRERTALLRDQDGSE